MFPSAESALFSIFSSAESAYNFAKRCLFFQSWNKTIFYIDWIEQFDMTMGNGINSEHFPDALNHPNFAAFRSYLPQF